MIFWDEEGCVGHAEWLEDPATKDFLKGRAFDPCDQKAQYIGGIPLLKAGPGLVDQWKAGHGRDPLVGREAAVDVAAQGRLVGPG